MEHGGQALGFKTMRERDEKQENITSALDQYTTRLGKRRL